MNVGIYIELGGIFTMKPPDSVIDLYAASAQVESQTRSENIKFGIQSHAERENHFELHTVSELY